MKNKILLTIIIVLLPITIFTLRKQVTSNSPVSENVYDKSKNQEIYIDFLINNEKKKILLEEYLINVVGAEVPALFDMEALKSQAVASRTFALYEENTRGYVTIADQAYNTLEELQNQLCLESVYSNPEESNRVNKEIRSAESKLESLYEEWEKLAE